MIKNKQEMLDETDILIESIRSQSFISEKSLQEEIEGLSFVKSVFVEDNGIGWDITTIFMHGTQYPVLARAKGKPQSLTLGLKYLRDYIESGQYQMQAGVEISDKEKNRRVSWMVASAIVILFAIIIILFQNILLREDTPAPPPVYIYETSESEVKNETSEELDVEVALVEEDDKKNLWICKNPYIFIPMVAGGYIPTPNECMPESERSEGLPHPLAIEEYVRPKTSPENLEKYPKSCIDVKVGESEERYNMGEWAVYQGTNGVGDVKVLLYSKPAGWGDGEPEMLRFEGETVVGDTSACGS